MSELRRLIFAGVFAGFLQGGLFQACSEIFNFQSNARLEFENDLSGICSLALKIASNDSVQVVGRTSKEELQNGRGILFEVKFPKNQSAIPALLSVTFNGKLYCEDPRPSGSLDVQNINSSCRETRRTSRQSQWEPVEVLAERSTDGDYIPLVLEGEPTKQGDFPWLVALFYYKQSYTYKCAATLVCNRHVVTGAHCIGRGVDKTRLFAVFGTNNIENWLAKSTFRIAEKIIVHPDYFTLAYADVAVIIVEPVTISYLIRPISLWNERNDLDYVIGEMGVIAGWGKDENDNYAHEARQISIPIVDQGTCLRAHPGFLKSTSNATFCAGARDGKIPCKGDSGGGFVMNRGGIWKLRGVVSSGISGNLGSNMTCNGSFYAVFTDLSKFDAWLTSILQEEVPGSRSGKILAVPSSDSSAIPTTTNRPPTHPVPTESSTKSTESATPNRNGEVARCGSKYGTGLEKGDHPWVAALYERFIDTEYEFRCTCNFLTRKHLITAGHCVGTGLLQLETKDLRVVSGNRPLYRSRIADIKVHPDYDESEPSHDLAILILTRKTSSVTVVPLCLWSGGPLDRSGVIAGSENTANNRSAHFGDDTYELKASSDECLGGNSRGSIKSSKRSSIFCGSARNEFCKVDSGAAFMVALNGKFHLRGIYTKVWGLEKECDYFVDVAKEAIWIKSIIE